MKYNSTRGTVKGLSFQEALCTGFASDGGMLLPESIPTITEDQLKALSKTPTYRSLASHILPLFISDEITQHDLEGVLDKAYSTFTAPDMIPLQHLSNKLIIAELFHGKSWSFKDYAMSVVGQLLEHFLSRSKTHQTALIATSGDTGSAAIVATCGMKWLDLIVALPKDRCSKLQELQMTTVRDDNIHVYRAEGCSDDLDDLFSKIYCDKEFVKTHNILSLNSVNWARIMAQIVHYFYIYLQVETDCGKEVEIVVPTGGCGNITAGCIARRMGLPIKLVSVVNDNDTVDKLLKTGVFESKQTISTIAPSMDIQMPYNMERVWNIVSNWDTGLVNDLMNQIQSKTAAVTIPTSLNSQVQNYVKSFRASEDVIKSTIKRCYDENKYFVCPHTAIGVAYHYDQISLNGTDIKRVILATAAPNKFPEVMKLSDVLFEPSQAAMDLHKLPTKFIDLEKDGDWLKVIKDKIIGIDEKIKLS